MNIAVCIKQVPDTETRPKLSDDGLHYQKQDIKWIVNPYDEFAIEEALQLTEKNGGDVTLISMGPAGIEARIRAALAMGAKNAIRINCEETPDDPLVIARGLIEVLKDKSYDLILFGKQAIDTDNSQVAQMVATGLNLPCATVVTAMQIDDEKITAEREIEGGKEKLSLSLPAVISSQKGLNEPRYRSLKGIMAAKKVKLEIAEPALSGEQVKVVNLTYPPQKEPGKIVGNGVEAVPELVRLLNEEAKVI